MLVLVLLGVGWTVPNPIFWNSMEVTVTAYNSTPRQTEGNPNIAAWGDRLTPDTRGIAVSRDLLKVGLDHEVEVWVEGFDAGPFVVLDKMNRRFKKRIDIFFGKKVEKAREFGKQTAMIYWK